MSQLRKNAREAREILGDSGRLRRIAALATVSPGEPGTGEWIVSALDSSGDGGIYIAAFSGPLAKDRAIEYAREKYSGLQLSERRQQSYR